MGLRFQGCSQNCVFVMRAMQLKNDIHAAITPCSVAKHCGNATARGFLFCILV